MKRALLVGCGAEIGASLVAMNDPRRDAFQIDTILTRDIERDAKNPHLTAIDSLYARIVLAQPTMVDRVGVDRDGDALIVDGRRIRVVWGESESHDVQTLGGRFDICILATSKTQIGTPEIIDRWLGAASYVVGVAEAPNLPAFYANLIDVPTACLGVAARDAESHRAFALGSCQSNGWHAALRAVLDMVSRGNLTIRMHRMEVDIVHPDTPTGRLGTHSVEARSQDPRNNLRPSFSQIEQSMNLVSPSSRNLSTVSLRTLTMPPGYQIARFFFSYRCADGSRLTRDDLRAAFEQTARLYPDTLRMAPIPLGSRGFEACESSAIMLSGDRYLYWDDQAFALGDGSFVSELITQTYVHNVRGYCRSVLNAVRALLSERRPLVFYPSTIAPPITSRTHADSIASV